MVHWPTYLAPWINDIAPGRARTSCTSSAPSRSSPASLSRSSRATAPTLVAGWLAGIVINLFSYPGWYDVALRDFGLMLAALTLARLASVYDPPLAAREVRKHSPCVTN